MVVPDVTGPFYGQMLWAVDKTPISAAHFAISAASERDLARELPPGDDLAIPKLHFTDPAATVLGERRFSG